MLSNPTSGDEMWVYYWLILVAISSFFFPANRKVDVKYYALLLTVSLVSVLYNRLAPQFPIYVHVFFNVFLGCMAVKVIAERMTLSVKQIGSVLILVWLVVYAMLILQSLGFILRGYELSGIYSMPWMMGSAAVLSIPFIRRMKSWYGVILILPIILSHSIALVLIALVMWVQPKLKWKHILIVISLAASYMLWFDRGIDHARFAVIKNSIPHIHNWFVGDGIGSWAHRAFVRYNGKDLYYWRWAHNELYQMTTEAGVLGAISVLALIFNMFKRAATEFRYYLFGIVALSMVHPIFHIPRLIPFLILILAIIVRRKSIES